MLGDDDAASGSQLTVPCKCDKIRFDTANMSGTPISKPLIAMQFGGAYLGIAILVTAFLTRKQMM